MYELRSSMPLERADDGIPSPAALPAQTSGSVRPPPLLLTRNPAMQRLLDELQCVAPSNSTVLLEGESGTGKEVIARAIHAAGWCHKGPFVSVNCASLPDGLLESELFGHERGAFTGAVRQRAGRFELAHGGTLFLDEIGAADSKVQLRLLRVLQEREFERLGGTQTIRTNVRVIAATNVELKTEVREERFRGDLYYRLNVLPLVLPPLRERREDIPMLLDYFLQTAAQANGYADAHIEPEAVALLQSHPWPGNIRQLENTLERMVVLSRGRRLGVGDIPPEIAGWREEEELADLGAVTYWEARDRFERRFLCSALQRHHGVISHVADAIGMSRKNLYTRMDQLRIDYTGFRAAPLGAR